MRSDTLKTFHIAVHFLVPTVRFLPKDVSATSLCATSGMSVLNTISPIRRWRSDAMLLYLHVQATPVMKMFASLMVQHVDYTLHTNHEVPCF